MGGYVTLLVGGVLFCVMYVWFRSRKIKNRYVEFVKIEDHIHQLQDLSNDNSIPKYATHLVYLTSANNPNEIEHKIRNVYPSRFNMIKHINHLVVCWTAC